VANNVFKFPGGDGLGKKPESPPPGSHKPDKIQPKRRYRFLNGLVGAVWLIVVLVWPALRWAIAIDVAFQGARMAWYWNTTGTHAGWTFLAHFAASTALTYFVEVFRPQGFTEA
jgi:hypothetical protein